MKYIEFFFFWNDLNQFSIEFYLIIDQIFDKINHSNVKERKNFDFNNYFITNLKL